MTAASANADEAMKLAFAGLGVLAAADHAAMPDVVKARCLQWYEQAQAMLTAGRARILGSYAAGHGYSGDGEYSARAWLMHRTKVTRAAARGYVAWARREAAHPQVVAALAEGIVLSESVAKAVCGWTDRLPEDCRDAADAILVAAARAGADEEGLAGLAAEILARSQPDRPDEDGDGFDDREVRLETTYDGAGVMTGNLTPECSAVVTAVLDALSAPAGAEDTRTHGQRYHDALEDAMRRLVASGLLPERAGQPVKVWAHVSLTELRAMDGGSVLQGEWIAAVRGKWAAHRAAASVTGSDGASWLDGDAARAVSCDASVIPVVTGEVDPGVLDDLVALCVKLAGHLTPQAREMIEHAVIGKAIDLVSGPGGLASFLRRQQLGVRLAGPSLPLDVGRSSDIPAAIRRAVTLRDQHCQWAGGCDQPAAACEVHHVTHLADGGPTSVRSCGLYCFFHHHVAIHRWGWTVTLNPDGTTTARSPDGTKVLRSHGPPPRPG